MPYSKRYQTVIAGRVRDDELRFVFKNKSALPPGLFTAKSVSASPQPVVKIDPLRSENIGKSGNRTDNKAAYDSGSVNSNK